ncbi:hypothetical protein AGMMS50255_2700 [Spirochaetia bacterium]|nr:hypothetical protein AGMMS50255_2700 [Spirochaetia bacterium]
MFKKIAFAVLFVVICFSAYSQNVNDFDYTENNGTITITGYKGETKNVTIPEKINGMPVTAIGDYAFESKQLTSVIIPNSVTSIGNIAFYENHLTSVTIPDSVTSFGYFSFGNNHLVNDTSPVFSTLIRQNKITIIGYNRETKDVVIPEKINGIPVVAIGDMAFGRKALTSVIIPNSVTSIGDSAFYGCQLTSVVIPNSVTSIGRGAFVGWADGAYYVDGVAIANDLTSIVIPDSVTSIGMEAFFANSLTSVVIGSGMTSIGSEFNGNPLTRITIGQNVNIDSASYDSIHSFRIYYDYNGKKAGTYTYNNSVWSYTAP